MEGGRICRYKLKKIALLEGGNIISAGPETRHFLSWPIHSYTYVLQNNLWPWRLIFVESSVINWSVTKNVSSWHDKLYFSVAA